MRDEQQGGLPEERRKELIEIFQEKIPFNRLLGLQVEALDEGLARLRIPFTHELIGDPLRPALHGGVVSTLFDATGGLAAFTSVDPRDRLSTVDLRIDYLRPAALTDLWSEATVLRIGNRVAVCDGVVYQGRRDRPIAVGKGVYNVNRKPTDNDGPAK